MLVCLVLFVIMALVIFVVQVVAKQRAKKKDYRELEKAILRMSDQWFKKYYEGCVAKNWQGYSRKKRRFLEAECKRRKIDYNKF